ncbi:hypothetical protein HFP51_00315 [Parasphingopyxis sp. CP4]|uniref:KAP family P-loop NTPase fold protein n=1 Tax=Parasphingopyxis sp. CP4 TaxID=2724527 RepID=UPI0015A4A6D5|nr:P-loop NTPase fold protein [Parasphingopyxis sp. CP4]QLC20761.1 hypothetical protein HFP51_00315 [Parasphingopyxis sp. CP4]
MIDPKAIRGDRELDAAEPDKLGFEASAKKIANALTKCSPEAHLVVGLEGSWGSGKSSMINKLIAELDEQNLHTRPGIIQFKPWQIGSQGSLMEAFFSELSIGIGQYKYEHGDATDVTIKAFKDTGKAIQRYAKKLIAWHPAYAPAVEAVIPGYSVHADIAAGFGKAIDSKEAIPLEEAKCKVERKLKSLPNKFVVIIDDIDRLEPRETIEIIRLIKSVANFPNILYLLSFDQEIVVHALEQSGIKSGSSFLEKILQIVVPMPVPDSFDLRRWFEEELSSFYSPKDTAEQSRIREIIDIEGGWYFHNPRSVVRSLDAIKFAWFAVEGAVDFADLVWVQIIKVAHSELYHWIVSYLTENAAVTIGGIVSRKDRKRSIKRLRRALNSHQGAGDLLLQRLEAFLPGFEQDVFSEAFENGEGDNKLHLKLFEAVDAATMESAFKLRRLSSPDHYKLFLSYGESSYSTYASRWQKLMAALDTGEDKTTELLLDWGKNTLPTGVSELTLIIDWLAGQVTQPQIKDLLTSDRSTMLVTALSETMDVAVLGQDSHFGRPQIWRKAIVIFDAVVQFYPDNVSNMISEIFEDGDAIGWLTDIVRSELFAHGRVGENARGNPILDGENLDIAIQKIQARFQEMSLNEIFKLPQPVSSLYGWYQSGDTNKPISLVKSSIESDDDFVSVLEQWSGIARVGNPDAFHEIVSLTPQNLSPFLDLGEIRTRLEGLLDESPSSENPSMKERVQKLLDLTEDAEILGSG